MNIETEPLLTHLHNQGRLRVWSLIITFFGDSILAKGGEVEASRIKALMQAMNIEAGTLRTALSRLTNDNLVRGGGEGPPVVCGQAIASAADTCSVLALTGFNKKFRNCTTVDMTSHFMRPLMNDGIEIKVKVLSSGRKMAVVQSSFKNSSGKLAATATCTFALLDI